MSVQKDEAYIYATFSAQTETIVLNGKNLRANDFSQLSIYQANLKQTCLRNMCILSSRPVSLCMYLVPNWSAKGVIHMFKEINGIM